MRPHLMFPILGSSDRGFPAREACAESCLAEQDVISSGVEKSKAHLEQSPLVLLPRAYPDRNYDSGAEGQAA